MSSQNTDYLLDTPIQDFTYSKVEHFNLFQSYNFDTKLFGKKADIGYCDLKVYQDMLTFAFMLNNLEENSKILEIGGGESRILNYFKKIHECWNLDKLEGLGNGPTKVNSNGINLVQDYIGNFNQLLPENYFDLVFSISTLEHIPLDNELLFKNILKDINRLIKPKGLSFHCMDHSTDLLLGIEEDVWTNPLITYFFDNQVMINKFVPLLKAESDQDLFYMSEQYYNDKWQSFTHVKYEDFGKPFSYNFLWRK